MSKNDFSSVFYQVLVDLGFSGDREEDEDEEYGNPGDYCEIFGTHEFDEEVRGTKDMIEK